MLCNSSQPEKIGTSSADDSTLSHGGAAAEPLRNVVWKLQGVVGELPDAVRCAFSYVNMSQSEQGQLDVQRAVVHWRRFEGDTGSCEVQVAVLSTRIKQLAEHMKAHHKDHSTKRRLQMLVYKRNRLLKYFRRADRERYEALIESLSIRPTKMFDPTLVGHPLGTKVTGWQKRGWNKHTPKRRKRRAVPYGSEKSAKGRVKLRKGATRQRRLAKARATGR